MLSGKPSLCILTGVCAVSSARINEGWLSPDACRVGISIGNPFALARLNGREKLKAGLGNRVPPADISEPIDGDLPMYIWGDIGDVEKPLPEENVRCGDILGRGLDVLPESSSELSIDIDLGLGVLCANGDRGGASLES